MLPKEYCSGSSTCHRRFQEWSTSRVFQKLWTRLLQVYDDLVGIQWRWQSLDSICVKAPLVGGLGCCCCCWLIWDFCSSYSSIWYSGWLWTWFSIWHIVNRNNSDGFLFFNQSSLIFKLVSIRMHYNILSIDSLIISVYCH
jgi:hypothetical protein